MKKFLSIAKMAVITLLSSACFLLLVCEVDENSSCFVADLLATKGAGLACGAAVWLLSRLWSDDPYITRVVNSLTEK